jgi:hypothetical protein
LFERTEYYGCLIYRVTRAQASQMELYERLCMHVWVRTHVTSGILRLVKQNKSLVILMDVYNCLAHLV